MFSSILESFGLDFFNYSFFLPPLLLRFPYMCMDILDYVSQFSEDLFLFLHSFFVFQLLRLDNLNCPIFKFAISVFCLVKYSAEHFQRIFHFSYYTLNSRIYKKNFYLFTDIHSLILSFSSLSVFKIGSLKFGFSKSSVGASSETVSIGIFPPCVLAILFCFFLCPECFVKN